MIKVGIVGSTGYAGQELIRILQGHKEVDIIWYTSRAYLGEEYHRAYQNMFEIIEGPCVENNLIELAKEVDVVFLATPHGYASTFINEEILNQVKVIDLSADFRIKDIETYESWYNNIHENPSHIKEAAYGLCEINRDVIKGKRLIANPGCYPTATILTLYPLVKEGLIDLNSIIVDAKSGVSGAGRGVSLSNLYCETNESMKAYAVGSHRHIPEIEEQLAYAANDKCLINFTPHLIPMDRGIFITAYAKLIKGIGYDQVKAAYDQYYKDEYFVRVLEEGILPETRWVRGSNYTDVNFKIDERTNRIIAMGAIDNLVKGAAGQAVQNMNILFDLKEEEGLKIVPIFP